MLASFFKRGDFLMSSKERGRKKEKENSVYLQKKHKIRFFFLFLFLLSSLFSLLFPLVLYSFICVVFSYKKGGDALCMLCRAKIDEDVVVKVASSFANQVCWGRGRKRKKKRG